MEESRECVGCEYLCGGECRLDGACAYRRTPEDALPPRRTTMGGVCRTTPEDGLRGRIEHA